MSDEEHLLVMINVIIGRKKGNGSFPYYATKVELSHLWDKDEASFEKAIKANLKKEHIIEGELINDKYYKLTSL